MARVRLQQFRLQFLSGLLGTAMLLSSGCGGYDPLSFLAGPNAALRQFVESTTGPIQEGRNTVTIRIANRSDVFDVELELLIDGQSRVFRCSADDGVCQFFLPSVPSVIQAIEESRWDEEDRYRGGTVFEGDPSYTFTSSQYGRGSVILFILGTVFPSASVL